MPDRYSYPNSLVLINKLGITDYDRWKAVETAAIHQRMVELTQHPIPGRFDLAHLQAIHRHLTQDLYLWGGDLRDTDTHPGGTGIAHCRPPFIVPEAERVFGELAARDYLRGLDANGLSDPGRARPRTRHRARTPTHPPSAGCVRPRRPTRQRPGRPKARTITRASA